MRILRRAGVCFLSMASGASVAPRIAQDKSRGGLLSITPGGKHTATFIGPIHGLGDTNMGWFDVAQHLHSSSLGHVKFVLPNAPNSPVTLNGGMSMPSWYDITSLDDRAQQECAGLEESQAAIVALIEEEVAAGIPLERIVVGGFSQGGALSLWTGLQYPGKLAGVACLSGYLPKHEKFEISEEARAVPIAHYHGKEDPTVRLEWARASQEIVRSLGATEYTLHEYDGLGHGANMDEIADLEAWVLSRIPPVDE